MIKTRLIFSGYPCPRATWEAFLPKDAKNIVVSFADMLEKVKKPDFNALAEAAAQKILEIKPQAIVCHDYSVTYVLLALLKLKRRKNSPKAKLTIFNGVFRGFDVFRAPHPIRSQYMSWQNFVKVVTEHGGEVDARFKMLNSLVKALYRRVIFFNLKEKITELFRPRQPLHFDLGVDAQLLASDDDYFIPYDVVELLRDDFNIRHFHRLSYGHFPYSSGNKEQLRQLIVDFE